MPRLAAKLLTAFQLTRLSLVFGAIADVWFVVLYTRADPQYAALPVNDIPLVVDLVVAAVLSIGLFAFATTLNDLLDVRHDATFSPDRPLPAGRIRAGQAVVIAIGSLLAAIAAAIRNAGSANPNAVMAGRGPFTAADITASPQVAEPFHLLDLCLSTEGASAFIVTTPERARDCPHAPAQILGGGSEWFRQQYVGPPRYDEVGAIGADAYARTFEMAGLKPSDIDVFELYDINRWDIVRQVETLGICPEGDGVDFLFEQGVGVADGMPINTDGGLLSFSHNGYGGPNLKVVESVRQLRGSAGTGQVADVDHVFLTGAGAGAQYHNAMILGR